MWSVYGLGEVIVYVVLCWCFGVLLWFFVFGLVGVLGYWLL